MDCTEYGCGSRMFLSRFSQCQHLEVLFVEMCRFARRDKNLSSVVKQRVKGQPWIVANHRLEEKGQEGMSAKSRTSSDKISDALPRRGVRWRPHSNNYATMPQPQ